MRSKKSLLHILAYSRLLEKKLVERGCNIIEWFLQGHFKWFEYTWCFTWKEAGAPGPPPQKKGWKVLLSTEKPPLPLSKKSCIAIFTSRDFWSITPLHCRQGWLFLCIIRGATLYGYRGRSRRDLTPPSSPANVFQWDIAACCENVL